MLLRTPQVRPSEIEKHAVQALALPRPTCKAELVDIHVVAVNSATPSADDPRPVEATQSPKVELPAEKGDFKQAFAADPADALKRLLPTLSPHEQKEQMAAVVKEHEKTLIATLLKHPTLLSELQFLPENLQVEVGKKLLDRGAAGAEAVIAAGGQLAQHREGERLVLTAIHRYPSEAGAFIATVRASNDRTFRDAHFYLDYLSNHRDAAPALAPLDRLPVPAGGFTYTPNERAAVAKLLTTAKPDAAMLIAEHILELAPQEASVLTSCAATLAKHAKGEALLVRIAEVAPDAIRPQTPPAEKPSYHAHLLEIRDAALLLRKLDPSLAPWAPPIDPRNAESLSALKTRAAGLDVSKVSDAVLHRAVTQLAHHSPEAAAHLAFRHAERFMTSEGVELLSKLGSLDPSNALKHSSQMIRHGELAALSMCHQIVFDLVAQGKAGEARQAIEHLEKGPLGVMPSAKKQFRELLAIGDVVQSFDDTFDGLDRTKNLALGKKIEQLPSDLRGRLLSLIGESNPLLLTDTPALCRDPEGHRAVCTYARLNPEKVLEQAKRPVPTEILEVAGHALGVTAFLNRDQTPPPDAARAIASRLKLDDSTRAIVERGYADGVMQAKGLAGFNASPVPAPDRFQMLFLDPALRSLHLVKTRDLVFPTEGGKFVPQAELPLHEAFRWPENAVRDVRVSVARNLLAEGKELTPSNVTQAARELFKAANLVDQISVVKGRSVYVLAHGETWQENQALLNQPKMNAQLIEQVTGSHRVFSSPQVERELLKAGAKELKLFTPAPSDIGAHQAKVRFLEQLQSAKENSTFLFLGHGLTEDLALTGGQILDSRPLKAATTIGARELATALIERAQRLERAGAAADAKDIVILDSCFSRDFLVNVVDRMREMTNDPKVFARLPLICAATDTGQYGYSTPRALSSNLLFGLLTTPDAPTVETLRRLTIPTSNPGLYLIRPSGPKKMPALFQLGQTDGGALTGERALPT